MLLIKTVVKPSSIAGVGLFADQDVEEGTPVWQYTKDTCILITRPQMDVLLSSYHKLEKQVIQYYLIYTYYQAKLNGLVLCLDNGRYVNHSENPNLILPSDCSPETAWQYSVAKRPIKKGEELTEDYRTYDSEQWLNELCQEYGVFHYHTEAKGKLAV